MSVEENKAVVQRFVNELLVGHKLEIAAELVTADVIDHDADEPEGHVAGVEGVRTEVGAFLRAFPDLDVVIDDLVGEGDKVVLRATLTGTQTGEFFGLPPSGKPVKAWVWQTYRFAGGKIAEAWLHVDRLTLMQQLGALPRPEQAPA